MICGEIINDGIICIELYVFKLLFDRNGVMREIVCIKFFFYVIWVWIFENGKFNFLKGLKMRK